MITEVSADSGKIYRMPLSTIGHALLVGGSMGKTTTAQGWIAQLCVKNSPTQVQVAVIDLTENQDLATLCGRLAAKHLAYIATGEDQMEHALHDLQAALTVRKSQPSQPDAWFIVIEAFLELEANPVAWPIVQALLYEGKAAGMYVLATTRHFLILGPLHDAFNTHMTFVSAPEDDSLDALKADVAALQVPDAHPIIFLHACNDLSLIGACQRCGKRRARYAFAPYIDDGKNIDDEHFARQWFEALCAQWSTQFSPIQELSICEACVSVIIDQFEHHEGVGQSNLAQGAQLPKGYLPRISFVGFRQVGQPLVTVVGSTLGTLNEYIKEVRQQGVFDPKTCPKCGSALELCKMCEQPKCWSCEGEMAEALKICVVCWNQYQTSVASHLQDMAERPDETMKKDWMPHVCISTSPQRSGGGSLGMVVRSHLKRRGRPVCERSFLGVLVDDAAKNENGQGDYIGDRAILKEIRFVVVMAPPSHR